MTVTANAEPVRTTAYQNLSAQPVEQTVKDANRLRALGFKKEAENLDKSLCPTCGGAIGEFKDPLSAKEFQISGMCQACQDKTFVPHPEDQGDPMDYGPDE